MEMETGGEKINTVNTMKVSLLMWIGDSRKDYTMGGME
jgi:hypothetical protein